MIAAAGMVTCATPESLTTLRAELKQPVGFVPTMGALHRGHLELVKAAKNECATVVASVFVNPLQFAAGEDFEKYPRDLQADSQKLEEAGVNLLFSPTMETMYPRDFSTYVDVGAMGATFEGAMRPTHFRGVTTVVCKLLHLVKPQELYLGQKDAQQTAVLRRMVSDLAFDVQVRIVPTVREDDGLAMSSRNVYLSSQERAAAPTLQQALQTFVSLMGGGQPKASASAAARAVLQGPGTWDYLDLVDERTFEPIETVRPGSFAIGAARFGSTRLLDNVWMPA